MNSAFSVTSLVNYEIYVDRVITEYLKQLRTRFADQGPFDLRTWLHFYSTDVIGEVVYGQAYGFLKTGSDLDDMNFNTQKQQDYFYLVRGSRNPRIHLLTGFAGWTSTVAGQVVQEESSDYVDDKEGSTWLSN